MVKNAGRNLTIQDTYSAVLIHDESNLKQLGFSLVLVTMPDLPPEKSICRSGSNIQNRIWKNRLVPNRKRSTSGCILSPCLFNFYAGYIMRNARLEETQAGIQIARKNFNHLRYVDDTTLMVESEEELKSLLMQVKEQSEKVGLKLNIWKMKIMTTGPIISWEIDGETVETVSDYFGGLQNHCRW